MQKLVFAFITNNGKASFAFLLKYLKGCGQLIFKKRTVDVLVIAVELKINVVDPNSLYCSVNINFRENRIMRASFVLTLQIILFIRFPVPSRS